MKVLKPEEGDAETAAGTRAEAALYLVTPDLLAAQEAEGRRRVEECHAGVEAIRKGESAQPVEPRDHPRELERDRKRSRHRQPPSGVSGDQKNRLSFIIVLGRYLFCLFGSGKKESRSQLTGLPARLPIDRQILYGRSPAQRARSSVQQQIAVS